MFIGGIDTPVDKQVNSCNLKNIGMEYNVAASAELLSSSRNDKLARFYSDAVDGFLYLYYTYVTYYFESGFITLSLWVSVISGALFLNFNGLVLKAQWQSIVFEIALVIFSCIGVFQSTLVNQRHASLVIIHEIMGGVSSLEKMIEFMKGRYQSRILMYACKID